MKCPSSIAEILTVVRPIGLQSIALGLLLCRMQQIAQPALLCLYEIGLLCRVRRKWVPVIDGLPDSGLELVDTVVQSLSSAAGVEDEREAADVGGGHGHCLNMSTLFSAIEIVAGEKALKYVLPPS